MTAQTGGLPIVRVEAMGESGGATTHYLNLAYMSSAQVLETEPELRIKLLMFGVFPGSRDAARGREFTVWGEQARKLQEVLDQFDLLKPQPDRTGSWR